MHAESIGWKYLKLQLCVHSLKYLLTWHLITKEKTVNSQQGWLGQYQEIKDQGQQHPEWNKSVPHTSDVMHQEG